MKEVIKEVIIVQDLQADESELKEMFDINDGQRLFDHIKRNSDSGNKYMLEFKEISEEEYIKACEIGDMLA